VVWNNNFANRPGGSYNRHSVRRSVILIALSLASLPSCQKEPEERFPPAVDECEQRTCDTDGPTRVPISGGVSGSNEPSPGGTPGTNAGGAPGSDEEPDGGGKLYLRGTVEVATSVDLQTLLELDDMRVRLQAVSPDGTESETSFGAGELFELEISGWPVRVAVHQTTGDPSLMDTIQWVQQGQTVVIAVERNVIQDIADSLTAAPLLDAERGHALITIVDSGGQPRSGASLSVNDGIVGYDIGLLYSDAETQTAERGSAVLVNVPASPPPGTEVDVRARLGGETQTMKLHLAQDSITLQRWQL